jgi:prolyl-tRNA synthetase
MKLSKSIWQTYKEIPAEAEIPSHQLMVRAGLIHKMGSGLYSYMPFAYRIIRKIEQIVREEMDRAGGQEILMNVVTPAELWQESGRWAKMGDLMLKFNDKAQRELCISPTNEEAVTDIFRKTVKSYKQLPITVYQINTKFRDEIRPRFGMMRAREFTMKDAYSFHMNKDCLDEVYENLYQAYCKTFERIGLKFSVVEADAGDMGGTDSKTHEFQAIAETGEDTIIYSETNKYAANIEKADTLRDNLQFAKEKQELTEVATPNMATIEDVCNFLKTPQHHSIKSLVYTGVGIGEDQEDETVLIQLLGDDELNELKLKNFLGAEQVVPATEEVLKNFSMPKGFIGAANLPKKIRVLFDKAIDLEAFYTTGAMKKDFHLTGFNPLRDTEEYDVVDLRLARAGDLTPDKSEKVLEKKGIEIGHIFQLGDKYTKAMDAKILNQQGKTEHPLMGCYGIGVSRVMAAVVEQYHDENGIMWPKELAPYDIYFALIGKTPEIHETANGIYEEMKASGFEVLFDDRKAGPGFKFKDSDLLGLPIRVVLGERDFKESGELEIVIRKSGEKIKVKKEELAETLKEVFAKI